MYTHISIIYLILSIIGLIVALVIAETVVYPVVVVAALLCIYTCIYALLLNGILKERPVFMMPAMIIVVSASEFSEVVQCGT